MQVRIVKAVAGLAAVLVAATIATPAVIVAQERGEGGGGGEGGPRESAPPQQLTLDELVTQLARRIDQVGEKLFKSLDEELLGRAAGGPRLGYVQLVTTPQGRPYVLGLVHEDLAASTQVQPGQTPSVERSMGVLVWGPADGSRPLSALLLRGIEKKDIRRGMVIARPGHLLAVGQGRSVVWEGPSLVRDEEVYPGADLRPNYVPRVVCMVTVDIESDDWPGFVPASEEGNLPVTMECVDIGWIQATGSPLRVDLWKVPGSVWRQEAVFKYRLARSGQKPEAVRDFESVMRSLGSGLGAAGARAPESWALSVVRAPGSPECYTLAVRMSQSPQGFVDVDLLRPARSTSSARVEPFAVFLRFRRSQDGQWQASNRYVSRAAATDRVVRSGPDSFVLVPPGSRRGVRPREANAATAVPFFGWSQGSVGLVLELPTGEALTFKNCGKSTSCVCPHVPCRRPWD